MVAYSPGPQYTDINYNFDKTADNPLWQQWAKDSGLVASDPATPAATPAAPAEDPRITAAKIAAEQAAAEAKAAEERRRAMTEGAVKAAFSMYGLDSLWPLIQEYAQQGLTEDQILLNLRNTDQYKARFPAMAELNKQGRAINEGAYIDYERKAASLEQMYGFPKGMVMGAVTDLLIGDVSAVELQERLVLASADSLTAPQDLRDTMEQYYNLDPDEGLRAYYLDPDRALPILKKQSASARIGVQATRAGVGNLMEKTFAEELQGLGVSEEQAQQGFGRTAQQYELTAGRGDTVGGKALARGNVGVDPAAVTAAQRAAQARVNRFAGGGGFSTDKTGAAAIGSASS